MLDKEYFLEMNQTSSECLHNNMPFQEYFYMKVSSRSKRDQQKHVLEMQRRSGQISIPHFDGSNKCTTQSLVQKSKTYSDSNPMHEEDVIMFASSHLKGDAHDWWHHGLIT